MAQRVERVALGVRSAAVLGRAEFGALGFCDVAQLCPVRGTETGSRALPHPESTPTPPGHMTAERGNGLQSRARAEEVSSRALSLPSLQDCAHNTQHPVRL